MHGLGRLSEVSSQNRRFDYEEVSSVSALPGEESYSETSPMLTEAVPSPGGQPLRGR